MEQVTRFRACKATIAKPKSLDPPGLELWAVLFAELDGLLLITGQYCRIGLARQDGSSNHATAALEQKSPQICERASLPDEIIHQYVVRSMGYDAVELCLPCQPAESIRPGMPNYVGLDDCGFYGPGEHAAEIFSHCLWDRIHSLTFKCVGGNQDGIQARK